MRAGDRAAIAAVLGPGANDLIDSGDPAEDMVGRARFVAAYEQSARVEPRGASRAELVIGPEDWKVPFPLVRGAAGWRFDARAGRDEVIARRVGRNELAAMQAALSFVDAQREYALTAHDGEGPGVYARRIGSAPGRHDGLYWTPTREDPLSPLGVLFTLAAADETGKSDARPYHGYFFRVLQGQGPHASGGAADYDVAGRMIAGFALVAYPARHRITGVRTFIVNQEGVVYSRDLGARTPESARMMRLFDPDPKWRRETAALVKPVDGERMRQASSDRRLHAVPSRVAGAARGRGCRAARAELARDRRALPRTARCGGAPHARRDRRRGSRRPPLEGPRRLHPDGRERAARDARRGALAGARILSFP